MNKYINKILKNNFYLLFTTLVLVIKKAKKSF